MIKVGSIYESNKYGSVKVIDSNLSGRYYKVVFLDTGTEKIFREDQILSGCIRDPYAKSVCGVACTGDVKTKGKNKLYYSIWHDMINRCYNPNNKRYNAYKSVSVSNRWLVFENFLKDVSRISGFDEKEIQCGNLVLDKDSKQRWNTLKEYSIETCSWISKSENNKIQDRQQKLFIAVSPDGNRYEDYNITSFSKLHGLDRKHVSGVLHGRCNTTHGWRFFYK